MPDIKGFLKIKRCSSKFRPVYERLKDYSEVFELRPDNVSIEQASRCMDCGTPFCHWACPVGNYIPEWNDYLFLKKWHISLQLLLSTNNFPEFTGRLCPAPCEYSCVLGINDEPVTIRENELSIIEYGFKNGYITPRPPKIRTGKRIAIVGSGPAGLACADQLNKAGHYVTVFEKDNKPGGILRYGIPDFKLEKKILDRRLGILFDEGVEFINRKEIGKDISIIDLQKEFDAICLSCGSRTPRDLNIPGRELKGIYFAMDYLSQANKLVAREYIPKDRFIDVSGKRVVIIGGGDTGADCVGTALRQGAKSVLQIELLPKPPECRDDKETPWPFYPMVLKTSTSHQEGGERDWCVLTKAFIGKEDRIEKLSCVRVEFVKQDNKSCPVLREVPNSEFYIDADVVILAMGFLYPEKKGLLEELDIKLTNRGNVETNERFMTSIQGVFAAGDMRRGQSWIVWAISEGRRAAHFIDTYLMGKSSLPNF